MEFSLKKNIAKLFLLIQNILVLWGIQKQAKILFSITYQKGFLNKKIAPILPHLWVLISNFW